MAAYKLLMPKMGESVFEATILNWNKKPGDSIEQDETVLEVATDKVDSDVPSPVGGVLSEILFEEGDTVAVGQALAIIETEQAFEAQHEEEVKVDVESDAEGNMETVKIAEPVEAVISKEKVEEFVVAAKEATQTAIPTSASSNKYYSPLVLNIAQTEGISMAELDQLNGRGKDGRVTKEDILAYVKDRAIKPTQKDTAKVSYKKDEKVVASNQVQQVVGRTDEIIEMDRMRKLISDHMTKSKNTSAHVSSFVEADLTNVVKWRDKHKHNFLQREGFKLSFMPVFVEAIVNAIKDFPMINVSVDGYNIIKKKDINVGVATALPSGNLIVPVIKKADQKSLVGIAREMNDIIVRARHNNLKPDDTQGGTYTISNIGTFGNIIGTPIINQPQVAIMAVGSITKKPAVMETEIGDVIAIRHKMYLSHTYDHRVVDGALGGKFVKHVGDYLENWDVNREL